METIKDFSNIWRSLVIVGSIVAAAYAVDSRYVSETVFTEFKEGTVRALIARLDRIESKLDAVINEEQKKR